MIKLDKGGLLDLNKEAKDHYDRLTSGMNNFISPEVSLKKWISDKENPPTDTRFIQNIQDDLGKIIKANPIQLRNFIRHIGEVNNESFSKEIVKHLRYENFRDSSRARTFIRNLDVKACPYCNAQFILQLGSNGELLCHFDHIYPKSKYPYLCISYFNLVPCCSHCNQFKSYSDPLNESSFFHPYEKSLAENFKFRATSQAIGAFHVNGRTKKGGKNLEIVKGDGINIEYHESKFKLGILHNEHNDIIDEVYLKSQIYNSSYYDELKQRYVDKEGLMTEDELKRIVNGTYANKHEINKRPLAKMTQDLLEQFNELKKE